MDGESSGYVPNNPYGQCIRCGFTGRLNTDFVKEWTGVTVCRKCCDERPGDTLPPHVWPEGLPHPNAQPKMPEPDGVRPEPEDL